MAGSRCMAFEGELTPKEMRFAEEYVKDFNGSAAVRRAGLAGETVNPSNTAGKLLRKPWVQNYIQNLMNAAAARCSTSVDDLMEFWTTVMLDANETTSNRLKASDYLAKTLGAYTVKVETQQAPTIVMDLGAPTPLTALPESIAEAMVYEDDCEDSDDIQEDDYGSDTDC